MVGYLCQDPMILTPFWIRLGPMFSFLCSVLCFHSDSVVIWTQLHFMFPPDSVISSYVSCDPQIYVSCFTFHHFPMFPSCALCFIISLSQTLQFPLDPILLSLLNLLRSCTRIPLQCIRSLVYIFCVLVLQNLRTNITYSPLILSEVLQNTWILQLSSGCLQSPLLLILFFPAHILVRSVNSYPLDSIFRTSLSTSGSSQIQT